MAKYARDNALEECALADVVKAAEAGAEGSSRGDKGERGDRTVLDALWPGIEALELVGTEGGSLSGHSTSP